MLNSQRKKILFSLFFFIVIGLLLYSNQAMENQFNMNQIQIVKNILGHQGTRLKKNSLKEDTRGEIIYFVLPDRFYNGDPGNDYGEYMSDPGVDPDSETEILKHGLKKDDRGYYHGGDLEGIIKKLPYLKKLGITAIWLTPIFKNIPVQGDTLENATAGYHGYWITDFKQIDPHLGGNEKLKELIQSAHNKGIKVYLDIITNHTADVIQYDYAGPFLYRNKTDFPYLDAKGKPFDDQKYAYAYTTGEKFPQLNSQSFPYQVIIAEELKNIKNPAWLNDPLLYHNRGETTYSGENSIYGDFASLDDLFTEHPRVIKGMVDIYKFWIKEFKIDGFRVDTVKHVNIEFWQQFVPEIKQYARSQGIDHFYIFGEVYDSNPQTLSQFTKTGKLPAVLDFGVQAVIPNIVNSNAATDTLKNFFENDDYYISHKQNAYNLPTFLGNHDMGRIGAYVYRDQGQESDEQLLKRLSLAYKILFTIRGNPTIFYGGEQGFTGYDPQLNNPINDKTARQDMFPSQVAQYQDPVINKQIGSQATPADDNFDPDHPIFKTIRRLSALRRLIYAFTHGSQIHRYSTDHKKGDVYAFSRIARHENIENVVALNSHGSQSRQATIKTYHKNTYFIRIFPFNFNGKGFLLKSNSRGELNVQIPSLDLVVYRAIRPLPFTQHVPTPQIINPDSDYQNGSFWIETQLEYEAYAQVSFYVKVNDGQWTLVGQDDNPPYRVEYDSTALQPGSVIAIKSIVKNQSGYEKQTIKKGIKIENRLPRLNIHYENGNNRDSYFMIDSNGSQILPRALDPENIQLKWQKGVKSYHLFFETKKDDGTFEFDLPVDLDLINDIYPYTYEDSSNQLIADIYINNERQISNSPNYTGIPPQTLPVHSQAANPYQKQLYIRGEFNGWGTDHALIYQENYAFKGAAYFQSGSFGFKFADAKWKEYNFGAPFTQSGLTDGSNPANLSLNIAAGQDSLYQIHLFSYPSSQNPGTRYLFYRVEKINGPLKKDIYLFLNGNPPEQNQRLIYQGNGIYEATIALEKGEYQFKIGDLNLEAGCVFGAVDINSQTISFNTNTEILADSAIDFKLSNPIKGECRFYLDLSDPAKPFLTVYTLVNHGPYGAVYLRGGQAISKAGWEADSRNLLIYDAKKKLLSFTVEADSTSTDLNDWQFKIATLSWDFQLTGKSDTWLDPMNEVKLNQAYALEHNKQSLYIQPAAGTYQIRVDVSDSQSPVLTIEKN